MMDAPDIPNAEFVATAPAAITLSRASSFNSPGEAIQVESDSDLAEAMRVIFDEHCWTIDQAFRWFDFNSRKRISRFAWDTGARILNLVKRLGNKSRRPFTIMSKAGEISLEDWREFFAEKSPEGESEDDDASGCDSGASGAKTAHDSVGARFRSHCNSARARSDLLKLAESSRGGRKSQDDADLPSSAGLVLNLDSIDEAGEEYRQMTSPTALPNLASVIRLGDEEDDLGGGGGGGGMISPSRRARDAAKSLAATDAHKAEAEQLSEELKAQQINGIKALAYIFVAKCGSLDNAFRWLDCNSKGSFANVQWQTAVMVMHIDIQTLTGLKPRDIFLKMGGKSGRVTKKAWERFFVNEVDDELRAKLAGLQKGFEERSRKRLRRMWKDSLVSPTARGDREDRDLSSQPPDRPVTADADAGVGKRQSSTARGRSLAIGGGGEGGSETVAGAAIARRVQSLEPSSAAADDRGDAVGKVRSGTKTRSGSKGTSAPAAGRAEPVTSGPDANPAVGADSKQSSMKPSPEVPAGPTDIERFKKQVLEELSGLAPDEGREYRNLKRAERVALQEIATKLNIWTGNDGQALMVYRMGPVAEGLNKQLLAVGPGERVELHGLPPARCAFVSAKGESFGLWGAAIDCEDGMKMLTMFNLGGDLEDFKAGMERTMKSLTPGQVVDIPWGALDEARREVIRSICEDLGLMSHCFGDQFSVGSLDSFAAYVRRVLEGLQPEDVHTFGPDERCPESVPGEGLPALPRRIACTLANAAGHIPSEAEDENGGKVVNVLGGGRKKAPEEAWKHEESDEEEMEKNVAELFGLYATGNQGRNTILRRPDLHRLTSDAAAQRNKCVEKDIMNDIEQVYDETLELQVDLGSRVTRGITLDYFQVFLSKIVVLLGWSLSSFLRTLLDWYDR